LLAETFGTLATLHIMKKSGVDLPNHDYNLFLLVLFLVFALLAAVHYILRSSNNALIAARKRTKNND